MSSSTEGPSKPPPPPSSSSSPSARKAIKKPGCSRVEEEGSVDPTVETSSTAGSNVSGASGLSSWFAGGGVGGASRPPKPRPWYVMPTLDETASSGDDDDDDDGPHRRPQRGGDDDHDDDDDDESHRVISRPAILRDLGRTRSGMRSDRVMEIVHFHSVTTTTTTGFVDRRRGTKGSIVVLD
mmetsp:Transcript_21093/g.50043  ORF Transcript_21093/g.50043 Transcript_21093/m.50043 type:complete len:182 (-) Transcript_21093:36-581(-)